MSSSSMPPTPRVLLTTLLTTLASMPFTNQATANSTQNQRQAANPPYDPPSNTLKNLSASHRALLTTLHVLLPTGVLLQALDLLDRGLVVRVVEKNPSSESGEREATVMSPQGHIHLPKSSAAANLQSSQEEGQAQDHSAIATPNLAANPPPEAEPTKHSPKPEKGKIKFYLVRSSQAPRSRFKDSLYSTSTSGSGLVYAVRLEAWNCSCAAFAFEAYPGGSRFGDHAPWLNLDDGDSDGDGDEGAEWEFGGLGLDGKTGEAGKVPICKHLLACLLAERWDGMLGGYVKEKEVGREEMAGIGGEG